VIREAPSSWRANHRIGGHADRQRVVAVRRGSRCKLRAGGTDSCKPASALATFGLRRLRSRACRVNKIRDAYGDGHGGVVTYEYHRHGLMRSCKSLYADHRASLYALFFIINPDAIFVCTACTNLMYCTTCTRRKTRQTQSARCWFLRTS
jgi:hypothetical protein